MKTLAKILILFLFTSSCQEKEKIDPQTYFLSFADKLPDSYTLTSDSLTSAQKEVIKKYQLDVFIPHDFKSIVDQNDPEAFIFFNPIDNSLLLAKCFPMNDSTLIQIENSTKYDSPIYGSNYNDLSEFKHFKKCEPMITDSLIGPFLFGGTLFDFLGANNVMHQEFLPRSKKYEFGEFTILFDEDKYLFVTSLNNGYSEDLNEKSRWQAFRFKN